MAVQNTKLCSVLYELDRTIIESVNYFTVSKSAQYGVPARETSLYVI
jgi:hypothetical protein